MSEFRTIVTPKALQMPIDLHSSVYLTGSCFAENIADKMRHFRITNLCNPFGVMYNPYSIAKTLSYQINQTTIPSNEFFEVDGQFRHPDFHSKLAAEDKATAMHNIQLAITEGHRFLQQASHLVITFGTSLVYQSLATRQIVANNHKLPASTYQKVQLSVEAVYEHVTHMLDALKQFNPSLIVIFTISPVRHWRDGAIANTRSKAVLVEALHQIIPNYPQAYYFPAYEMMMDDLRDYRFYADDMLHPSSVAIDYIWHAFSTSCFTAALQQCIENQLEINAAMQHRPFFPDSKQHQEFRNAQLEKVYQFQKKYPSVDVSDAIQFFSTY